FVRAFDHAATGGHGSGAAELGLRCGFGNSFAEDKAHRLFDAEVGGREAMVFQSLGDQGVGAFILLPDADVGRVAGGVSNLLAGTTLFECRAYVEGRALSR